MWKKVASVFGTAGPSLSEENEGDGVRSLSELGLADFERELATRVLRKETSLLGGQVNFVNLAQLRERLGDGWARFGESIHARTRATIEKRIASTDIFTRVNAEQYLILFTRLSEDEARLKCALIAKEIEEQIFGEGGYNGTVTVRTAVTRLDGAVDIADIEAETLMARFVDRTAPVLVAADGSPDLAIVDAPAPVPSLHFLFRPIWHVQKKVVTTFGCVPVSVTPEGTLMTGPTRAEPAEFARIDGKSLAAAAKVIAGAAQGGRKLLVACPVHFMTLARPGSRRDYTSALRLLPEHCRELLVLEVLSIPHDMPQLQVSGVLQFIRPLCRSMIARVPIAGYDLGRLVHSGIVAVGSDLGGETGAEMRLLEAMQQFVERAGKDGMSSYLYGLGKLALVTFAVCAGYRYLAGDAVVPFIEQPSQIMPFEIQDIYAHLAAASEQPEVQVI